MASTRARKRLAQQWQEQMAAYRRLIELLAGTRLDGLGDVIRRYAAIMLELGWPPVEHVPMDLARKLTEAYDAHGADAVRPQADSYMLDLYDPERLTDILAEWEQRPILERRMPVLRQAVEAHNSGKCFLSIPALLAQLEGLIYDCFGYVGIYKCKHLEKCTEELLKPDGSWSFDEMVRDFYLNYVLAKFLGPADTSVPLSRHAILHGADTSYGTPANSLKVITLFDYVVDRLCLVTTRTGTRYHLPGCPLLRSGKQRGKDKPDRTTYRYREEAEWAGKTPCKLCKPDESEAFRLS